MQRLVMIFAPYIIIYIGGALFLLTQQVDLGWGAYIEVYGKHALIRNRDSS